jgi:hypothetical protein
MTAMSFLEDLRVAARDAEAAEAGFRREVAARISDLEQQRAFAFRRLNLMQAIAEAAGPAEDEPTAMAYVLAALRARLNWESDSEARAAVLARFAPVAQAVFATLKPNDDNGEADIAAALARFETWYAQTHTAPFWTLFEHYIPETPRVDF